MKTIELNLSNGNKITVVKDKIETIKSNPNENANCWITLTSGKSLALTETVEQIKEYLSEQ
ncbi:hypothetical protein BXQ17_08015 [Polaribacter sp. BM10]|uniref:flagellar FlbD family protein n=1 Tax=Polaribacter sp. BM10 TaxID=1529069 RepID=UPI00098B93CD|nr:flagellar FlbD family protein [Polaribacter sp. BM10]AQS94007.1 hypothetical protein BXQ17_07995 [Polaribacter sp. BM10]AQS94011.1 hypothetical protein BXQ17_08015 [Polaribacter sp. BM10]